MSAVSPPFASGPPLVTGVVSTTETISPSTARSETGSRSPSQMVTPALGVLASRRRRMSGRSLICYVSEMTKPRLPSTFSRTVPS